MFFPFKIFISTDVFTHITKSSVVKIVVKTGDIIIYKYNTEHRYEVRDFAAKYVLCRLHCAQRFIK